MEFFSENGNPFYPLSSRLIMEDNSVEQVEAELARRGLQDTKPRTRIEMTDLLCSSYRWLLSRKDFKRAHQHRLQAVQKSWLDDTESSFRRFGDLPAEIRIAIWEMCCFTDRRIVHVFRKLGRSLEAPKDKNRPNPGVLAACRESRDVAKKYFHLIIKTKNIYFNPRGSDILYVSGNYINYLHWDLYTQHITRLAVGHDGGFGNLQSYTNIIMRSLPRHNLTSLKELMVVINKSSLEPGFRVDFQEYPNPAFDEELMLQELSLFVPRSTVSHIKVTFVSEKHIRDLPVIRYENLDESLYLDNEPTRKSARLRFK